MEYQNRMKKQLLLLVCVLTAACLLFGGVSAATTAEATGACTNAVAEGIEYFIPYTALAAQSDEWRAQLTAKASIRPDGGKAGDIVAIELQVVNSSTRYQCTNEVACDGSGNCDYSCNSLPKNGIISGVYLRYIPSVSEDTKINFKVRDALDKDNVLLNANGVVKMPPYPCARNDLQKDFKAADGSQLILNTDSSCSSGGDLTTGVKFYEQQPPFAMVNIIPGDKLEGDRVRVAVSPKVSYSYKIDLVFAKFDKTSGKPESSPSVFVAYKYDPDDPDNPTITYSGFDVDADALPLTLVYGTLYNVSTTQKNLFGNDDYPTSTDFEIKFWYENTAGTLGYENSAFHFKRNLNVQFAPVCTAAEKANSQTGIGTGLYDPCGKTDQTFFADLTYVDSGSLKGVEVPSIGTINPLPTKEPKKAENYWFATRKCADSTCDTVKTTTAEVYSITYVDGSKTYKTSRPNGHAIHSPGSARGFSLKPYKSSSNEFTITGVRLTVREPGTYVVYGFITEKQAKQVAPTGGYAAKFYVVVPAKDQLDTCSTLANNGYFRAWWDDCQDSDKTQLLKFEHIAGAEEAWVRNSSSHGVHFPYVAKWSYVPQKMEVASLSCKFEALDAKGQPAKGYCRPNDVYVPPYTKVTITGGSLYMDSIPKSDEYRVAYAREETYNIAHLYFEIYVKECDKVKKIPDTGISLRSPLKVDTKVNAKPEEATSYVFTGNSLRIPAIGLGMETPIPIVHVYYKEGAENLEWDLSTLGNYVGELEGGAYLPYAGNSALTGHYYSMGVFKNLEYLNLDDEIIVFGNDGIKYTYRVVQKFIAQPEDVYEMFQLVGERSLTLVTCENYNLVTDTYERRQLIRATIASQEPYEVNW